MAEVGDVGDNAAPDQVTRGRETLEDVSEGHPRVTSNSSASRSGVRGGVAYETREVARTLVS